MKKKNNNKFNLPKTKKSNNKLYKSANNEFSTNLLAVKKFRIVLASLLIIFLLLIIRLIWLQFVQGSDLKEQAYNQQTTDQIISTSRGTIYDSTGKTLAISTPTDTVTINPKKIVGSNDEETKAKKEKVAKAFSEIFELDYNETLEKVNSTSNVQTIAKKVDKDKIDKLKQWMETEKISTGINIDEDTKRVYPYNNLASNLIGFCGTDNTGIQGIEDSWNSVLQGTPGKITTSTDAIQEEIPDSNQTYIPAENGSDIVLTIDYYIQTVLEKYLKQAVEENNADSGTVVAMAPSTGDILGMACYPDYNLNTPFEPNTEELKATWDTLDSTTQSDALYNMWKNNVVSSPYEPGSPYKLITAATALEENITSEDVPNDFYCNGSIEVADRKISCWTQAHKGAKTLRQALQVSCNPSLIQLGQRIGAETLYKYYQAFGFFDKTGIDLPQEASSTYWKLEDVKDVELATMSFGQRFTITPIQLVSAVSAIANDGILMKPRIVKQIINPETGTTTDIEPVQVRQVISKSTSERMRNLMKSVVDDGSGRLAKVEGYSIGGKTGTSEPQAGREDEGYIASYVAIAPTEKPEICLLIAVHNPNPNNEGSHQGGQVCGPVVSQMLSEILPYLGLTSSNAQTSTDTVEEDTSYATVPDIRNKTVTEAEKLLKQAGFTTKVNISGDKNSTLVTDQTPKPGSSIPKGSIIVLYTEENDTRVSVKVPDFKDKTLAQAENMAKANNLNITTEGSGTVISQSIMVDTAVEEGTIIKLTLSTESDGTNQ
ncbi:penicillin-binding protein transpeptidase [Clostridium sp. CAG:354]|jgi:peptidoglycan glycosyltransferase|uniref:penicillin-binding transpeptidase domain-containing protein n=1 Tax=Candidatus Merdicola sp. TaxID=3085652 RepID=UPI000340B3C0|nr:penicillin-binding transpeptidase domain-containing protein [Clostridia bacterium]CDE10931.1 penicillin-binding protein transpeptidase [Clostridium sp. CAG:354]